MSRDPSRHPRDPAVGHTAHEHPSAGGSPASLADVGHQSQAAGEGRTPRGEVVAINEQHERERRRFTSPGTRGLGPVEYMLLALIALGVAITLVMAIVNP